MQLPTDPPFCAPEVRCGAPQRTNGLQCRACARYPSTSDPPGSSCKTRRASCARRAGPEEGRSQQLFSTRRVTNMISIQHVPRRKHSSRWFIGLCTFNSISVSNRFHMLLQRGGQPPPEVHLRRASCAQILPRLLGRIMRPQRRAVV